MDIFSKQLGMLDSPIIKFSEKAIHVEGVITLPATTGQATRQSMIQVDILVIEIPSIYITPSSGGQA